MGKWMSYKVDKMLPTSIAAIAADNEHWVPYCEKAYAKERIQMDQRKKNRPINQKSSKVHLTEQQITMYINTN